jgi:fermentation-respiration switch protein FrsA (DUF1100 family)
MKRISIQKVSTLMIAGSILAACSASGRLPATQTAVPVQVAIPTVTVSPAPQSPFEYDASVPFDVSVNTQDERDGVTVVDLSYAGHDPAFSPNTLGRTLAYLVRPPGEGPFAGIIFLHWLGTSNSNRGQFLDEAVTQARQGAVCLLLQGFFPYMSAPRRNADDRPLIIGQVIELRRAIDFLLAQPGVDPGRLGYVGHDYGAVYGGTLSGVDHRIKTYVLVAGTPSIADIISSSMSGDNSGFERDKYLQSLGDLDPIRYVLTAAPSSIFFQFGQRDALVSMDMANSFYAAASQPKKVEWYDDLHSMASDAVRQARDAWLADQLGIQLPPK